MGVILLTFSRGDFVIIDPFMIGYLKIKKREQLLSLFLTLVHLLQSTHAVVALNFYIIYIIYQNKIVLTNNNLKAL